MFGRKDKKAIALLPPQHQQLAIDKQLVASMPPAAWYEVLTSIQHHEDTVKKHPLPARVRPFVIPLLRVLLEDVPADGYLGLRLDGRGHNTTDKAGPVEQFPVTPPDKKRSQHFDFDPWLAVEAKLTNKAKLDVWVADVVRVRDRTYRSASNKTKSKTKTKGTQRVRVKLTVPAALPVAAPAHGVPGWCRITMARDERHVVLDGRSKYPVIPIPAQTRMNAYYFSHNIHNPHSGPEISIPGQLNNVLLLIGELFRWLPNAGTERAAS